MLFRWYSDVSWSAKSSVKHDANGGYKHIIAWPLLIALLLLHMLCEVVVV